MKAGPSQEQVTGSLVNLPKHNGKMNMQGGGKRGEDHITLRMKVREGRWRCKSVAKDALLLIIATSPQGSMVTVSRMYSFNNFLLI